MAVCANTLTKIWEKNATITATEYLLKHFTILIDYSAVTALMKCTLQANYYVGQLKDTSNIMMCSIKLCKI